MRANTMVTSDGTLTQLHEIDGKWMTGADLLDLARRIHQLQIDGQRLANEPVRHEATPLFHEYPTPTFEESADFSPSSLIDRDVYRHAEEKSNEQYRAHACKQADHALSAHREKQS